MSPYPWSLEYWKSGEFQVVQERLRANGKELWNPGYKNLFAALRATPFDKVKVVVLGQDPYPNIAHATGIAFSVPPSVKPLPPTLQIILSEYVADLHYPYPSTGDLTEWCKQGVLLWNVVPSCDTGHSLSHDWIEWELLTDEILRRLSEKQVVFVACGTKAAKFLHRRVYPNSDDTRTYIDRFPCLITGHPSPRGNMNSKNPFTGSRIFTRINGELAKLGVGTINWRL